MMPFFYRGPARILTVLGLLFILCVVTSLAQVVSPPPPTEYKVVIRYQIRSSGQIHVARFRDMVKNLEAHGLRRDPGAENEEEDPEQTRITGAIAAERAAELFQDRHVQAVLLMPGGYDLAAQGEKAVKVQLALAGRLPLERQRLLSERVVAILNDVGFREAVGYDNRGHTRIVGTIAASNAETLLEDLRWHGSGWLAPRVPVAELPLPIRDSWPVISVEVMPEPAGVPAARVAATAPPADGRLLKISLALRALVKQPEKVRMEVILASEPTAIDTSWRNSLSQAASGSLIDGRLGAVVSVRASPRVAADYARLSGVSAVRLAPLGVPQAAPVIMNALNQDALHLSGLDKLLASTPRGQRIRIVVIDTDFRGYGRFVGKQLPGDIRTIDLAAECDPDIQSRIVSSDTAAVGHGTQWALAFARAVPHAELTLLRVDADAPFQVYEAARYINGEAVFSLSLEARATEQAEDSIRLTRKRDRLQEERKSILEEFGDDEAARKKRADFAASEEMLAKDENALHERDQRLLALMRALRDLKGSQLVACGLLWNEGYPADSSSPLSRYLDGANSRSSWFETAGNIPGQIWSGLFRDMDGNGVMEFAAPTTPLARGRWTAELNFLGWKPFSGSASQDLPPSKVRITVQWREPHDPDFAQDADDAYLTPLARLRLLALRQRDPTGAKLPTDDLEVIAASSGLPQRLSNQPTSAVYEQTLEFTVDAPGRYALRVEGRVPRSIRPSTQPTLRGVEVAWELRPRIFVNVVDDDARTRGHAVFWDYADRHGNPGMPADAQRVPSVAAVESGETPAYRQLPRR